MSKLDGKVAWVTGAGTGIGEAAAIALAQEGARVVLTGRRRAPLEEVAARIGAAASIEVADVTDAKAVDAAVSRIVKAFSRLDILVNNAGVNVQQRRNWHEITAENIDTVIHGNLSSAFYCARAVLPQMREQGGGVLIHTASIAGRNLIAVPGPTYVAAKHAVVAMSHTINMQECINNIRSTALLPGEVNTPILQNRPRPPSDEELAKILQPEDCGDLIRYIACLPDGVNISEVWIAPTWNRRYVAELRRPLI